MVVTVEGRGEALKASIRLQLCSQLGCARLLRRVSRSSATLL